MIELKAEYDKASSVVMRRKYLLLCYNYNQLSAEACSAIAIHSVKLEAEVYLVKTPQHGELLWIV